MGGFHGTTGGVLATKVGLRSSCSYTLPDGSMQHGQGPCAVDEQIVGMSWVEFKLDLYPNCVLYDVSPLNIILYFWNFQVSALNTIFFVAFLSKKTSSSKNPMDILPWFLQWIREFLPNLCFFLSFFFWKRQAAQQDSVAPVKCKCWHLRQ